MGCTEKGLYGLELGVPLPAAQAAYAPAVAGGSWSREGSRAVIEGEKLLPNRTELFLDGETVIGLRMRFDKSGIVAANEHPVTLPQTFLNKQQPEGAAGPFEHSGMKFWMDATTLYGFAKDGDGFTIERHTRAGLGAGGEGCDAAAEVARRLASETAKAFGEDGARTRDERLAEAARLRPLAAAAELLCPESSGVLTVVGDFFRASGAANGALERYKKAMKVADGWGVASISDAHAGIGAVSFQYRKDEEAAEHYRLAIERSSDSGQRAKVSRAYADDLHQRERYGEAAKYYATYLENTASTDQSDLARVHARLLSTTIEQPGGCKKAEPIAEKGLALDQAKERSRAAMLAAEAFRIIACDPKKKKDGYKRLEEAVKLDPLMAAEWSRLTAYYDREAQDEWVLKTMVENGWLDPKGLKAAREYQKEVRGEAR
ncbi:MAG: hypothetical protein P1V51_11585 [Deltaproteobacteria bacterium]|nr:hypothetical protein [Deltaproteobacteria bacterium]